MLRAAIWGVGKWGQTLVDSVHGKSDAIGFTVAIARTPSKYEDFAKSRGIALAGDPATVLSDPDIDAVVIATANSLHPEHVRQAAEAGKHAFVEKPFGLKADDALSAVRACERAGVVLGVGFNRRFLPSFRDLEKAVKGGDLGRILHVEGQFSGPTGLRIEPGSWRGMATEAPAGGMTARGIHVLDSMIQLCGRVASTYAISERRVLRTGMDDTTSMLFRFSNGATGYLSTIMATGHIWNIHVFGTKGWVEMRGQQTLVFSDLDGKETVREYEAVDIERAELEAFAAAVNGGAAFPVLPDDAVHTTAVLEAVTRSAETGHRVVIG